MLSLNISLVYVIINLLIFYFLMKKFLFGPVHRILDERQKLIAEEMAQAKSLKEAAQQEKEQYEASMHDAKTEAENVLRKAKEDADAGLCAYHANGAGRERPGKGRGAQSSCPGKRADVKRSPDADRGTGSGYGQPDPGTVYRGENRRTDL